MLFFFRHLSVYQSRHCRGKRISVHFQLLYQLFLFACPLIAKFYTYYFTSLFPFLCWHLPLLFVDNFPLSKNSDGRVVSPACLISIEKVSSYSRASSRFLNSFMTNSWNRLNITVERRQPCRTPTSTVNQSVNTSLTTPPHSVLSYIFLNTPVFGCTCTNSYIFAHCHLQKLKCRDKLCFQAFSLTFLPHHRMYLWIGSKIELTAI